MHFNHFISLVLMFRNRHETYKTQFRAVFVQNVKIMQSQFVRPIAGDDDPTAVYVSIFVALGFLELLGL